MQVPRLKSLFSQGKHIYQNEGATSLLRRGFAFLLCCFFEYRTFYIYTDHLDNLPDLDRADFMPRISNFTLKLVSSNEEADSLELEGLEFRSQVHYARKALDRGATASCIFVGQELANIGWVALTQEAKDCLRDLPYRVDFSNEEACTGGAWTNPKYRAMGIQTYGHLKRLEFLQAKGIQTKRSVIAKNNLASQRSRAKLARPGPHAEGRYLKILRWESWKERQFSQVSDA